MSFSSAIAEARKTTGSAVTMGKLFIGGETTKWWKDSDFIIRNSRRIVYFSSTTAEAGKTTGSAVTMGKIFIRGEMTKWQKDSDFLIRNGGRRKDYGLRGKQTYWRVEEQKTTEE